MTVRELLSRIDSREFGEWVAYDAIEPFGDQRADLRSGIVAAVCANPYRKGPPFRPVDFMPFVDRKPQTQEEMTALLRASAHGNCHR